MSECSTNEIITTTTARQFNPNQFFHMVQITDVHIEDLSENHHSSMKLLKEAQERYNDYITLTHLILPTYVKPQLVTISGDLTHAIALNNTLTTRTKDWIDRRINIYVPGQCLEQWELYSNITNSANEMLVKSMLPTDSSSVVIKLVYPFEEEITSQRIFDCPGNHDSFGVSDKMDENKFLYLKYSKSSRFFKNGQSYVIDIKNHHQSTTYRLIMFDTTPSIGSYRPVNFFSSIKRSELKRLEEFLSRNSQGISQTFAFGHYPSSMISIMEDDGSISDEKEQNQYSTLPMSDFFKRFNIVSYFSGHLHREFFEMTKLIQNSRHLEVQSPDFKKERSFKVITFDNDRIGFKDFTVQELEKRPGVFISHPKDCRLYLPMDREPKVIAGANFIRLFIIYPHHHRQQVENELLTVRVLLDGTVLDENLVINKDQTEYRIKFDFRSLNDDVVHNITVEFDGKVIAEHLFTSDDSICEPPNYSNGVVVRFKFFISWCVLSLNWRLIFRTVTHYSCLGSIAVLVVAKSFGLLKKVSFIEMSSLILQSISMRYGVWFLGVLTEDERFGGFINLTYFYFNSQPLNSLEPIHKLEPFNTLLSDHFNRVTIIDDSSIFFTLVGPTFVFSHLSIIIGYFLLECLDRIEMKFNKKYFKIRIFLFLVVIVLSHMLGFFNYYRKYVRSYGKFVLFTSFNNVIFPFLNVIILSFRVYNECFKKQKLE